MENNEWDGKCKINGSPLDERITPLDDLLSMGGMSECNDFYCSLFSKGWLMFTSTMVK